MIDSQKLNKILGDPDSPTSKLVALRQTPGAEALTPGVWYSNFSRVKGEAEARGLPFFAVWTNGEMCGFCRRFSNNLLGPTMKAMMRAGFALMWLGGSMDGDDTEDGVGGKGFRWCRGPEGKVSYYPFVSYVKVVNGKDVFRCHESGNDYDMGNEVVGERHIFTKIHNIERNNPIKVVNGEFMAVNFKPPEAPAVAGGGPASVRFNPEWDKAHVDRFRAVLKDNGGYCPCRPEKTADTKCMCTDFRNSGKPGLCHCGAFERYVKE